MMARDLAEPVIFRLKVEKVIRTVKALKMLEQLEGASGGAPHSQASDSVQKCCLNVCDKKKLGKVADRCFCGRQSKKETK